MPPLSRCASCGTGTLLAPTRFCAHFVAALGASWYSLLRDGGLLAFFSGCARFTRDLVCAARTCSLHPGAGRVALLACCLREAGTGSATFPAITVYRCYLPGANGTPLGAKRVCLAAPFASPYSALWFFGALCGRHCAQGRRAYAQRAPFARAAHLPAHYRAGSRRTNLTLRLPLVVPLPWDPYGCCGFVRLWGLLRTTAGTCATFTVPLAAALILSGTYAA